MRAIFLLLLAFAQPAFSFEYLLRYERVCGYENRDFPCKNSSETATIKQLPDGRWVGTNENGSSVALRVTKNDEFVLVLEDPVLFSGSSMIHLMKATGRFYWSVFAYSEILEADEGTVRVGSFDTKFPKGVSK